MINVSDIIRMTELDNHTFHGVSQILKAMIPYMGVSSGRQMALLARILEIQNTMEFFDNPKKLSACGVGSKRPEPEEMLKDLRKYMDSSESASIDQMLNMMNMFKMYEKLKDNPEFGRMFSQMQNAMAAMSNSTQSQSNDRKDHGHHEDDNHTYENPFPNMPNFDGQNSDQMVSQLKSMLTPEQRQMFEALSSMNQK